MSSRPSLVGLISLTAVVAIAMASPPSSAAPGCGLQQSLVRTGEAQSLKLPAALRGKRFSIKDFWGGEVGGGTVSASTPLFPDRSGETAGYFEIEVREGRGTPSECRASVAILPQAPPRGSTDAFGVMTHFAHGWDTDVIPKISAIGLRHIRDEHYWAQTERERGRYTFPDRFAAYLEDTRRAGIDTLMVLSFENKLYDDGATPHSPDALGAFGAYAQQIVRRYPQLKAVEVWNEYNGTWCKGPCEADRPAHYAAMLSETYRSVKAISPGTTVLGASTVLVPKPYFEELFAHGALDALDVVSFHPYGGRPEGIDRAVSDLRRLIERSGPAKPMWATELGSGSDSVEGRRHAARYLVRAYAMLLNEGVERGYWYLLRDDAKFNGRGLLRRAESEFGRYAPAPAYVSFAVLMSQVAGLAPSGRVLTDSRTRIYHFQGGAGDVYVAWAPTDRTEIEIAAEGPVSLFDMMGRRRQAEPSGDGLRVGLDEDPIYIHGTGLRIRETRRDQVVADSEASFGIDGGGWRYRAYRRSAADATPPAALDPDRLEELHWTKGRFDYRWTSNGRFGPLALYRGGVHPGAVGPDAVWALREWESDFDGPAVIVARMSRRAKTGDGVSVGIYVDRSLVRRLDIGLDEGDRAADLELPVSLRKGQAVSIAVGPRSGVDFDATSTWIQILRPRP